MRHAHTRASAELSAATRHRPRQPTRPACSRPPPAPGNRQRPVTVAAHRQSQGARPFLAPAPSGQITVTGDVGRARHAHPARGQARGRAAPRGAAAGGAAGAGTGLGAGGRAARRGDEPGHRRRVRPAAHRGHRPRQAPAAPGLGGLSARERELVTLVAQATPTPRSPPGCTPASTRSAPTWNRSGTRPAPAAAPT
jgi:hypothetical protein